MHVSKPRHHWYAMRVRILAGLEISWERWEILAALKGCATCRWPKGTKRSSFGGHVFRLWRFEESFVTTCCSRSRRVYPSHISENFGISMVLSLPTKQQKQMLGKLMRLLRLCGALGLNGISPRMCYAPQMQCGNSVCKRSWNLLTPGSPISMRRLTKRVRE